MMMFSSVNDDTTIVIKQGVFYNRGDFHERSEQRMSTSGTRVSSCGSCDAHLVFPLAVEERYRNQCVLMSKLLSTKIKLQKKPTIISNKDCVEKDSSVSLWVFFH